MTTDSPDSEYDVVVVGGGVAGRSAAIFTARADFDTLVCDTGESIVRRNAHLENYPGFPAGVNARRLLDMMGDQAAEAGAEQREAAVTRVDHAKEVASGGDSDGDSGSDGDDDGGSDATGDGDSDAAGDGDAGRFVVETDAGDRYRTKHVIAATKNATDYLDPLDGVGIIDRGKEFVDVDEGGRTGVDGLYAAGRLAEKPHQTVVCAGHGAEVAVALLEDDERAFYHDWVAPDGYFTDRGRDLPPGCEEIDADERRRREAASREATRAYFAEPHPDEQETHPSVE